jgi:hypothetical protein
VLAPLEVDPRLALVLADAGIFLGLGEADGVTPYSAIYPLTNFTTTSLIFAPCLAQTALNSFLSSSGMNIRREIIFSSESDIGTNAIYVFTAIIAPYGESQRVSKYLLLAYLLIYAILTYIDAN